MHNLPSFLVLAFIWVSLASANAQSPPPGPPGPPPSPPGLIDRSPSVAVSLPNNASAQAHSHQGRFPHFLTPLSQTITVYLRFSSDLAGTEVIANGLDGGTISSNALIVGNDGTVSFQFQPGTQPGLYRLFVNAGDEVGLLQFEVEDQ